MNGDGFHLHAVTVEPAAVAARTLEEAVAEDGLDGVQADGAGLRQTDLRAHRQGLSGTVVRAVGPGDSKHGFSGHRTAATDAFQVLREAAATHGKSPVYWQMKRIFLLQGKWTILLQLLTLQPMLAPFVLHTRQV